MIEPLVSEEQAKLHMLKAMASQVRDRGLANGLVLSEGPALDYFSILITEIMLLILLRAADTPERDQLLLKLFECDNVASKSAFWKEA